MTDPLPPNDAVRIPALLTRVCRHCSAQSQVQGDFCPNCGKPFAGRTGVSNKALVIGAVVVLILIGGGASAFLVKRHNDDVAADKRAAVAARVEKRVADKAAAEKAAQEAKQAAQEAADAAERKSRREQVRFLERTITKDAGKDVAKGLLDGPILRTVCTATGGGSTDDLTALTGTFGCLAVTTKNSDGTESGYGYAGTIDWGSGRISWQLGG